MFQVLNEHKPGLFGAKIHAPQQNGPPRIGTQAVERGVFFDNDDEAVTVSRFQANKVNRG